jgi:hypothetical protein
LRTQILRNALASGRGRTVGNMEYPNIDSLKQDSLTVMQFEILLSLNRLELEKTFAKTKVELNKMINEIKSVIKHARINSWNDVERIWNVSGFIVYLSLDLKSYIEIMLSVYDSDSRNSIIKMIFIQVYEALDDLKYMTGKHLRDSISAISTLSSLIPELEERRTSLIQFDHDYSDELRNIRVKIGAHRDHDFIVYDETSRKFDYLTAANLVVRFDSIINNLGGYMQKIMDESAKHIKSIYS